jgi:hypothetical protein
MKPWVFLLLMAMVNTGLAGGVPQWLAGKPDIEQRKEWCAWYQWLFTHADRQTGEPVSEDRLARKRLVNLANRLAAHHQASPQSEYQVEIRYLWLGKSGPVHFTLQIDATALQPLLKERDCEGGI